MIDTLSDVLGSVRLVRAAFCALDASVRGRNAALPTRISGSKHVIECHVVTQGTCAVRLAGEPELQLEAGDVLVLAHGAPQLLSASSRSRDQDGAQLVCGFLDCEARPFTPLLSTLPRVMHRRAAAQRDSVCRRLVELALVESTRSTAGSVSVAK